MKSLIVIFIPLHLIFGQFGNNQSITKTGTTIAQFLKIGMDARSTSMGGAVAGQKANLSGVYWNPASIAGHKGIGIQFGSNAWLAAMKYQFVSIGLDLNSKGIIGINIINLSSPNDFVRTVEQPHGTGEKFSSNDLSASITYAKMLTDRFSLGGSFKFIQQSIWHSNAKTFAVDIGTLFETPFNGIRLGASISNYGGKMRMQGRDQKISVDPDNNNEGNVEFVNAMYETEYFSLPLFFRVGLSGELIKTESLSLTVGIDALHPNDNTEYLNLGLELNLRDLVFIRAGLPSYYKEDTVEGPSFGFGLNYFLNRTNTLLIIDYSLSDFGSLGGVKRLNIGFNF
tara:strand:+ start:326 stop:1348 length:1023 start_codon:yes stop_codon:yes gene_type:complete